METATKSKPFPLGKLAITADAVDELHPADVRHAIGQHARGNWGEVCAEDAAENELGLKEGFRLLSVYRDRYKQKFYVITEADRSVTTVLLPDDY